MLDFGIARLREMSGKKATATQTGSMMGTPAFMAPEQARGRWDDVDHQTDLWSVGATMFTLITGRFVHQAETLNEVLALAVTQRAPTIATIDPSLPAAVAHIIDKALAYEKAARWADANEMQEAVRAAYHSTEGQDVSRAPAPSLPDASPGTLVSAASVPEITDSSVKQPGATLTTSRGVTASAPQSTTATQATKKSPPVLLLAAAGGAVLLIGVVVIIALSSSGDEVAPETAAQPVAEPEAPPTKAEPVVTPAETATPTVDQGEVVSIDDLEVAEEKKKAAIATTGARQRREARSLLLQRRKRRRSPRQPRQLPRPHPRNRLHSRRARSSIRSRNEGEFLVVMYTRRVLRWGSSLVVVATVLAVSGGASAQSAAAAAEGLFDEARTAMDAGDLETACAKFRESDRLDPAVGTKFNLANCEEQRGKLAAAWELYRAVVRELDPSDERTPTAKERVAALEPRVPRIKLVLADGASPETKVKVGALDLGAASFGSAIPMDPGVHNLVVTAPGQATRTILVKLKKGETKEVLVGPEGTEGPPSSEAPAAASGPVVPSDDATPPTGAGGGSNTKTLGYALGGVGVAGIAVGSITGVIGLGKASTAKDNCDDERRICGQAGFEANKSAQTMKTVSTVGFVVGIVGLGAGPTLSSPAATTGRRQCARTWGLSEAASRWCGDGDARTAKNAPRAGRRGPFRRPRLPHRHERLPAR